MKKHIGLFEGIGGFSIAAESEGYKTIAWCEIDENCQYVLQNIIPNATRHTDIKRTDFTIYRGQCDLLTGGFPCQPYSVAGKQLGTEDDRHLWPEMLRAIREIRPTWVICENVRGLVSWNDGLVFEQVQSDLESEGYEVISFILPAAGVNAPHKRDRVWIIAKNTNKDGWRSDEREKESNLREQRNASAGNNERICPNNGEIKSFAYSTNTRVESLHESEIMFDRSKFITNTESERSTGLREREKTEHAFTSCNGQYGSITNANNSGFQRCEEFRSLGESGENTIEQLAGRFQSGWENFPTQSLICTGDDGFCTESLRQFIREDSQGTLSEEEIDKIFSESISEWNKAVIKQAGNAIVNQVARQIIKAINETESYKNILY